MLVLTRKVGERIAIEPGIHLTVVAVEGRRVRLGIDAPESVAVLRSELLVPRAPARRGRSHCVVSNRRSRAPILLEHPALVSG